MKKLITLSGILAIILSQAGCVGGGEEQPKQEELKQEQPKQEQKAEFPYATQEIKQELAKKIFGQNAPIPEDFFETVNYAPMMQIMGQLGPSVFGEKEEQQVFWYYVMRLRMLTMYYTYPRAVDDGGILVEQLNMLGGPARKFIEEHPQEGQAIFASVIDYEEKHPYNPQKGIDEKRAKIKSMAVQTTTVVEKPTEKSTTESKEAPSQKKSIEKVTLTNQKTGEKIEIPVEEFKKMTRQEFGKRYNIPQEEVDSITDEEWEQQKQALIQMFANTEELAEELGQRLGEAMDQLGDALKESMGGTTDVSESSSENESRQLQYEEDYLEDVPEEFAQVRQKILQAFRNDLEQMRSGKSQEEFAAEKKAEAGITDYTIYFQAPEVFPAEIFFAEFILDPNNDDNRYAFQKLFLKNGSVSGEIRVEDDKPLPHQIDLIWYSIIENKTYSLKEDLPYESIKEKLMPEERTFHSLLLTLTPYGQVSLYAYDPIKENKELLAKFEAEETEVSLTDFRQSGALYENPQEPAKDWKDYQEKALTHFPKAATFLANQGLPGKDFNFWDDINVDYPLPEKWKLNELNENGETPLIDAVRSHKDILVTKLLSAGADVSIVSTNTGETALSLASSMGYTEYVKQLIEAGANVNQPEGQSGMSPLMLAARLGNIEVVKLLIEAGANVNAKHFMYGRDIGYNALKYAREAGNEEIVNFLVSHGAQEPIVQQGPAVAPVANSLDQAVMAGNVEKVKEFLANGANPNTLIPGVGPALLFACTLGNAEIVQALVDAKVDVNSVSSATGFTPLMMAAQLGNKQIVEILIKAGADVNVQHQMDGQPSGLNALKIAQNAGFTEVANILKAAGAKEE